MAASASLVFSNQKLTPGFARETIEISVKLAASSSFPRGSVMGELTATPGTFGAYASGNADGTQNPKGLLVYDCQTDALGNITFSDQAGVVAGQFGNVNLTAPLYIGGWFLTQDLVQAGAGAIDANAVTKPGFQLAQGTTALGILHLLS